MSRNIFSFLNNSNSKKRTLKLMEDAHTELRNGRLATARDVMLKAYQECQDPFLRVMAAYNLGAIFWANIGDGHNARKYYQLAVEEAEKNKQAHNGSSLSSLLANTFENLMHLSINYEEYFGWVERLRTIQPTDVVLSGMVPAILESQESGVPWATIIEGLASNLYNRKDPSLDRGEYARAIATYHLILLNRKAMRLAREAWGRITYEYGTLALRVATDASVLMERSKQSLDKLEFMFIVDAAKIFVDEYLAANPSDNDVQFLSKNIGGFLLAYDHGNEKVRITELNDEGLKMLARHEYEKAIKNFKEGEKISREIGDQAKLQACIGNLALVALNTGDLNHALELNSEKEEICLKIGFNSGLAYALANKALILASLHRINEAHICAEEAIQLCRQYGMDDIALKIKPMLIQIQSTFS